MTRKRTTSNGNRSTAGVEQWPPAAVEAVCTSGYCDRPAVAAVYLHALHTGAGPTVLIRGDHLEPWREHAIDSWRCLDCLHNDIGTYLPMRAIEPRQDSRADDAVSDPMSRARVGGRDGA